MSEQSQSRTYAVKEAFYTLQGEGLRAGRPAVFCRFAGCNLWTGREQDRASAQCQFCDTDFVGTDGLNGGKYDVTALASLIASLWPVPLDDAPLGDTGSGVPYVVFTGGEPMLQLDPVLCAAIHAKGFEIAVETNGTLAVCHGVDWICVSPKAGTTLQQVEGDELKVIYPQTGLDLDSLSGLAFAHHLIQPLDDPQQTAHTQAAVAYCQAHPQWRLSLQTHKLLGIR
jgi:7-carboxy-7-deazaguanine synthase (Cx14CxxC type)